MKQFEHGGRIYGLENTDILDFSVNLNPLGMPPKARKAISENIDSFIAYPDCDCLQLKKDMACKLGIAAECILPGNGASDVIFRICACYRPAQVLVCAPTFSEYERSVRIFGGSIKEHLLSEDEGFALTERILDDITPDLDMVFLCNPNNPNGKLADRNLLIKIIGRCAMLGIRIVIDECFIEFTEGTSLVDVLPEYPNLILLGAFTKIYGMAGLRLGYMLAAPDVIKETAIYGPEWNVSSVAQTAGCASLKEEGWVEETKRIVAREREYLVSEMKAAGLETFASDANFLLIKSKMPLYEVLKEQGVLVRNCSNYTGLDESFIRIGIQNHAANVKLVAAIKKVLNL